VRTARPAVLGSVDWQGPCGLDAVPTLQLHGLALAIAFDHVLCPILSGFLVLKSDIDFRHRLVGLPRFFREKDRIGKSVPFFVAIDFVVSGASIVSCVCFF
jgi:hypothetical protein